MRNPKVSIIIPTYNHSDQLPISIVSCLNQTFKDIEIIVIDDGSIDNTRDYISGLQYDKRIQYYYQPHKGLPSARNHGLRRAKGRFIQFLDADDIILPIKLEKQLECFEKYKVSAVHCDFVCQDGDSGNLLKKYASPKTIKADFLNDLVLKWELGFSIPCHCFLFDSATIGRLRFDEDLPNHEDWVFYVNWAYRGYYSLFLNSELCIYRVFTNSMSRDLITMEKGLELAEKRISSISPDLNELINLRK